MIVNEPTTTTQLHGSTVAPPARPRRPAPTQPVPELIAGSGETLPPHDEDAEREVLGGVLLAPEVLADVRRLLPAPGPFFREAHRRVYAAMCAAADDGNAPALGTVWAKLSERGQAFDLQPGTSAREYLLTLRRDCMDAALAPTYARTVRKKGDERAFLAALGRAGDALYDHSGEDRAIPAAQAIVTAAVQAAMATQTADPETCSLADLMSMEFPPLVPLVDKLLYSGTSMLVTGRSKDGKSFLCLSLALALAAGAKALGTLPTKPRDVLYLCLEDGRRRAKDRLQSFLDAAGLTPESVPPRLRLAFTWPRLNEGGLEALRRWMAAHPGGVVFVDILEQIRPARGANVYGDDYASLAPLTGLAHDSGGTVVAIHHNNKLRGADVDPMDMINGSMGMPGAVDGALIFRPRKHGETSARVSFIHRDAPRADYVLTWDEYLAGWRFDGESDSEEAPRRSPERQAIVDALAGTPAGRYPAELATRLSKSPESVRYLLHKMHKAGEIVRDPDGRYFPAGVGTPNAPNAANTPNANAAPNAPQPLTPLTTGAAQEREGGEGGSVSEAVSVSAVSALAAVSGADTEPTGGGQAETCAYGHDTASYDEDGYPMCGEPECPAYAGKGPA